MPWIPPNSDGYFDKPCHVYTECILFDKKAMIAWLG